MKKIATIILKICVSVAILVFLFRKIDPEVFWNTVISVSPKAIVAVAFLIFCNQCLCAFRWLTLLKKDIGVSYLRLLSIYFIGMYFNNFLPTMVGGDIVKGYLLYKNTSRGDVSFASIFMDRYSGFTALMSITAVAFIPGYALIKGTNMPLFVIALLLGFVCISLVLWVGPLHSWAMRILAKVHFYGINKKIDTFYNVLMSYRNHWPMLAKVFGYSIIVQGANVLGYYFLGTQLGMNVSIGYYFLFIPLTTTISMLPLSLSGIGIREGAFVFLFTAVGATSEQAMTLSLMWFVVTAIVSLIGGIEYVRAGGARAVRQA